SKNVGTSRVLSVNPGYTVNDGNSGSNYTVVPHASAGSISARPITIRANDRTKTYADTVTFAGTEFTVSAGSLAPSDTAAVTVTSTDLLSGKVLGSGVKVTPVSNTNTSTGTANTVVTLSTGQYGAMDYLIEVSLTGNFINKQQLPATPSCSDCTGIAGLPPYNAAHPMVVVMIPSTINSMQGGGTLDKLPASAGKYGDEIGRAHV